MASLQPALAQTPEALTASGGLVLFPKIAPFGAADLMALSTDFFRWLEETWQFPVVQAEAATWQDLAHLLAVPQITETAWYTLQDLNLLWGHTVNKLRMDLQQYGIRLDRLNHLGHAGAAPKLPPKCIKESSWPRSWLTGNGNACIPRLMPAGAVLLSLDAASADAVSWSIFNSIASDATVPSCATGAACIAFCKECATMEALPPGGSANARRFLPVQKIQSQKRADWCCSTCLIGACFPSPTMNCSNSLCRILPTPIWHAHGVTDNQKNIHVFSEGWRRQTTERPHGKMPSRCLRSWFSSNMDSLG